MIRLGIPDLVSPSYLPAVAAIDLGFFKNEGLDVELNVIYPVDNAYRALRNGDLDLVCGSAHAVLAAFPNWEGARILAALSQGMYWHLVTHSDFGGTRQSFSTVKGKRIGAASMVELGLRGLFRIHGIELDRDQVKIVGVPPGPDGSLSFGLNAAKALESRAIDGFWANGMGARVAVLGGFGTVITDVRRDGPQQARDLTFPAMVTSQSVIDRHANIAEAAVRALTKCQHELRQNPESSAWVGRARFPAFEAELIADLMALDVPYLEATVSEHSFDSMQRFASEFFHTEYFAAYETVVPRSLRELWHL
jgi:NitT/TauT family transport system substrate-binding protein